MTSSSTSPTVSDQVWKFFASVKLSVIVLLLTAVTSIFGTLIPQNGSEEFYIHRYGEAFSAVFHALDLVDMYHAWWFLALLGLLCINIVICSLDRLKSTWKIIFPKKVSFNLERFRRQKIHHGFETRLPAEDLLEVAKKLFSRSAKTVETIETETGRAVFAETGRWTRFGVYIVHASILLLLIGAVIGSVFGYKGFVSIPEGETQKIFSTLHPDAGDTPLFSVRCNSFSVRFYDTGHPEEFKSNLTILETGSEVFTADIIVNQPLRYRGISLYQSSYGTVAPKTIEVMVTSRQSGMAYSFKMAVGDTVDLPENGGTFSLDEFVPNFSFRGHAIGESFAGKRIAPDGSQSPVVIPLKFPTFDKMRQGAFVFSVGDLEKRYYTGLQVTKDPGVWYVYSGFILMIVGCWITFFMSHQSLCVDIVETGKGRCEVTVYAFSNRNPQSMKIKAARLADRIKENVS